MVERRSSHFEAPRSGKSSGTEAEIGIWPMIPVICLHVNFKRKNNDQTAGISDKPMYL